MNLSSKTEYNSHTTKMMVGPGKSWIQIQFLFESRNQTYSKAPLRSLIKFCKAEKEDVSVRVL
jgi:hypothetical protein